MLRARRSPIARKFAGAYYHRFGLSAMLGAISLAFRMKMRPEATVFGFSHLLKGWTVMDHLHDIDVPTLVVAGRDDFLFPPEHQAILADRLPNAELEIIERAGHEAPNERPADVIASIRRFLTVTAPTVSPAALVAAP